LSYLALGELHHTTAKALSFKYKFSCFASAYGRVSDSTGKSKIARARTASQYVNLNYCGVRLICHVLIIEDDPFVAMHLSMLAEDAGATSIGTADTEADAVMAAQEQRPDVILSDVRLIEGTGPRAVARIYSDCGPIPVIFVTGTPEECEPCHYAAAVLIKPVNDRALITAFTKIAP